MFVREIDDSDYSARTDEQQAAKTDPQPAQTQQTQTFNDQVNQQQGGDKGAGQPQGSGNTAPSSNTGDAKTDIQNNAQNYNPQPEVTTKDDVTAAVNPVLTQAQQDQVAAQQKLTQDQTAQQDTTKKLNSLYNSMDEQGVNMGRMNAARRLENQQAQQTQQVKTDQQKLYDANATVASAKVVVYSQQSEADTKTAKTAATNVDTAYDKAVAALPKMIVFEKGKTLSPDIEKNLTGDQRTAYNAYVRSLVDSNTAQAKVYADNAAVSKNYAQVQLYASDTQTYGNAAATATQKLNNALSPQNLTFTAPKAIDKATAQANLNKATDASTYWNASYNAGQASLKAMDANTKVANLQDEIKKAEQDNKICLAPNAPLKQQLAQAQKDATQANLNLNVASTYFNKVQGQLTVKAAQEKVDQAQANYDAWRKDNPNLAMPGSPAEQALAKAKSDLSLAQQQQSVLDNTYVAAQGQVYSQTQNDLVIDAQKKVDDIKAQIAHLNVCLAPDAPLNQQLKAAEDNLAKVKGHAQDVLIYTNSQSAQANKQALDFKVTVANNTVTAAQQKVDALTLANPPGTNLTSNPDYQKAQTELTQAKDGLAFAQQQQSVGQYQVLMTDFTKSLPANLRDPQTDDDKKAYAKAWDDFFQQHQASLTDPLVAQQFGGLAPGQKADVSVGLKELQTDIDQESKSLANRSWLEQGWDFVSQPWRNRSDLETYLNNQANQLKQLDANKDKISAADFNAQYMKIMGNVSTTYSHMGRQEAESDEKWQQAGDIARFALATAAAVGVTVLTGGAGAGVGVAIMAGTVAGFGAYQVIDGAQNALTRSEGGDVSQNAHISLITLAADTVAGRDTSGYAGRAWLDAGIDGVQSFTAAAGTGAAGVTSKFLAAKALPQVLGTEGLTVAGVDATAQETAQIAAANASRNLIVRVGSPPAAAFVNQSIMGTGQMATTAIQLQSQGKLFTDEGGKEMLQAGKDQLFYLATAPVAGGISGVLPNRVAVQVLSDATTNVGMTWGDAAINGRQMNELDWFGAGMGTIQGTMTHMFSHTGAGPQVPGTEGVTDPKAVTTKTAGDPIVTDPTAVKDNGLEPIVVPAPNGETFGAGPIETKIRDTFKSYLPEDLKPTGENLSVLNDADFEKTYKSMGGKGDPRDVAAFIRHGENGEPDVIEVRDSVANANDPRVFAHELFHYYMDPTFRKTAQGIEVVPGARFSNLSEGVAQHLTNEMFPAGEDAGPQPYSIESLAAKSIADKMGDNFYKAVFQGDSEAISQFEDLALELLGPSFKSKEEAYAAIEASLGNHSASGAGGDYDNFYLRNGGKPPAPAKGFFAGIKNGAKGPIDFIFRSKKSYDGGTFNDLAQEMKKSYERFIYDPKNSKLTPAELQAKIDETGITSPDAATLSSWERSKLLAGLKEAQIVNPDNYFKKNQWGEYVYEVDDNTKRLARLPGIAGEVTGDMHYHTYTFNQMVARFLDTFSPGFRERYNKVAEKVPFLNPVDDLDFADNIASLKGANTEVALGPVPYFCGTQAHYATVETQIIQMANLKQLDTRTAVSLMRIAHDRGNDGPARAAGLHGFITALDFSGKDAKNDPIAYTAEMLSKYPGIFTGFGELTGDKEHVSTLEGASAMSVDNPIFRGWLDWRVSQGLTDNPTVIHNDWSNVGFDDAGRPGAVKGNAENFRKLIRVFSDPNYKDLNLIFAHTGIGRTSRGTDVPIRLENIQYHDAQGNLVTESRDFSNHVDLIKYMLERIPHAKFDISWNDVMQNYADAPQLGQQLMELIKQHPKAFFYGSDSVRPVTDGQLNQSLNTGLPLVADLVLQGPEGREAAWRLYRGNFNDAVDAGYESSLKWAWKQWCDENDVRPPAGMEDSLDYARLYGPKEIRDAIERWNELSDIRGRPDANSASGYTPGSMRDNAWKSFQAWADKVVELGPIDPSETKNPGFFPAYFRDHPDPHDHPHMAADTSNRNWLQKIIQDKILGQIPGQRGRGTSGGYKNDPVNLTPADKDPALANANQTEKDREQHARDLANKAALTATAAGAVTVALSGGAVAGNFFDPQSGLNPNISHVDANGNAVAFAVRGGLTALRALYDEAGRFSREEIFEEGHVTRDGLDRFVSPIFRQAKEMGFSDQQLFNVAGATEQFWANFKYLADRPLDANYTADQRYQAVMAKVGEYQSTLGRILGVDAGTVGQFDARSPLGKFYRIATLGTYLMNDAAAFHGFVTRPIDLTNPVGIADAAFRVLFALGNFNATVLNIGGLSGGFGGRLNETHPLYQKLLAANTWIFTGAGAAWVASDGAKLIARLATHGAGVGPAVDLAALALDAAYGYASYRWAKTETAKIKAGPMVHTKEIANTALLLGGSLVFRELLQLIQTNFTDEKDDKGKRADGTPPGTTPPTQIDATPDQNPIPPTTVPTPPQPTPTVRPKDGQTGS
jgi:hypothetical protein